MAKEDDRGAPGLFSSMWRYKWLSLAIVVVIAALAGAGGQLTAPPVAASSTVALTNPGTDNVIAPGVTGDATLTRYTMQRAQYATSDEVLDLVAKSLGDITVSELRSQVTVDPSSTSNVMTVTATAPSAERAVALANAVTDAYRQATLREMDRRTKSVTDQIDLSIQNEDPTTNPAKKGSVRTQAAAIVIAALGERQAEILNDKARFGDGVDFVQAATASNAVIPGPPVKSIALGIILGLAVAGVVSWLRADRDRRINDPLSPQAMLEAPLLATLPRQGGRRAVHSSGRAGSRDLESLPSVTRLPLPQYRLVGAALVERNRHGMLAVVGPPSAVDRVEAALNVAAAVASEGGRVLVVDADPSGRLSQRLGAGLLDGLGGPRPDGAEDGGANGIMPLADGTDGGSYEAMPFDDRDPSTREIPLGAVAARVRASTGRDADTMGPVSWLTVHDDVMIALSAPGRRRSWDATSSRRQFVDELIERVHEYDLVVIDVPPPDTTPLVPALLRASTGVLAVVPRGSDESAIAELRRTADMFSTPILGYVYTGARA